MAIGKNIEDDTLIPEDEIKASNKKSGKATDTSDNNLALELEYLMKAVDSASCYIEFTPEGYVINANKLFLDTMGYTLDEVKGKHHKIFCLDDYVNSKEYTQFWNKLAEGEPQSGEFRRVTKEGKSLWFFGHYSPVKNKDGKIAKVIKLASDITSQKEFNVDVTGQLLAINKSNAVVELTMDGTITKVNEKFVKLLGYRGDELEGQHHSMLVGPSYANSIKYKQFWEKLYNGEYITGEFKLIGKNEKEIWVQASYNPIYNIDGELYKVIIYSTDITERKLQNSDFEGQINAINKSYGVIEFDMEGNILHANENFLNILGYKLDEVRGLHHSIFVDKKYKGSQEYANFWKKLNKGNFDSGTYLRISKDGGHAYIQATYNPIFDLNGTPYKVVKYAIDVTSFTLALKEVSSFIGQLREGNFDVDIKVKADGDVGKMIEDNIKLRDTLKSILEDINNVIQYAGHKGDLTARLKNSDKLQGIWKLLVDSLNMLLESVSEPVLEFNTIIKHMADGDLTQKFKMGAKGNIQEMADSLNIALENLNKILAQIEKSINVIAESSTRLQDKSESVKSNTNEVASAISQIAKGAQDQAARTDESSKLVANVLASSGDMERKADGIYETAESGQQRSEKGLTVVANLVDNMSGISNSANRTFESINILTMRAEEIARTLNVITDIAAQTNLLALNAAIEAARAGDAGRGFAVVAEEIRKLAENSRKSAIDIEKIIKDVQKDMMSAGKAIESMTESVHSGNKATKEAESIFQEIASANKQTLEYSKEIKKATIEQKDSIGMVVKNIEQIVVVAEETAAGTQQVASSSEQLNNSIVEVTSTSKQLEILASELKTGISKFKLVK